MGGGPGAAHPPLEQLEHPRLSLPTVPAVLKQRGRLAAPAEVTADGDQAVGGKRE